MGWLLRALLTLVLGVVIGAVAVSLQPQWAAEIAQRAQPLLAQFTPAPAVAPAPLYLDAVPVKDELDGGFNHFLGPTGSVRSVSPKVDPFGAVLLTIVVDRSGNVVSASATDGPAQFQAEAIAIARRWKFKPFERNGQPVLARLTHMPVGVRPPERWQDYRQPFPEVKDWSSLRISLQRTQCFGACTDYSVEIAGDGKVTYVGRGFVAIRGEHHAQIDPRLVKDLVQKFRAAQYFSLLDTYAANITDNPTYFTGIAFDGTKKAVADYVGLSAGMPDAVHDLENAIDIAADTDRWLIGNARTVPSLIAEGWDFKSTKPDNLTLAPGIAQYGDATAMSDLIAAGAPLTSPAQVGYLFRPGTALEIAAARGESGMVRALLAAPAHWPKDAIDGALLQGARAGVANVTSALIVTGANAKHKDGDSHTVLMSAAESGVPAVVWSVLRAQAGSAAPGGGNTDVNVRDGDGKTALIFNTSAYRLDSEGRTAVDRGAVVRLLLKAGADIESRDNNGNTALIADHSFADVAAALLKGGANVNAQNNAGETALMTCIYADVAAVLLRAGADPDIRNAKGQTALEVIEARNYGDDVAAFLRKWIAEHPKRRSSAP